MKKIYESPLNGWDESAERLHIYALENNDEYWALKEMTHEERCDWFNVFDEFDYEVAPGAMYKTYSFDFSSNYVIMHETVAYNV